MPTPETPIGVLEHLHAILKFAPPILGVLMSLSGPLLSGGITGRTLLIATASAGLFLTLLERLIALTRRNNPRKVLRKRIQGAYTAALDMSALAPARSSSG